MPIGHQRRRRRPLAGLAALALAVTAAACSSSSDSGEPGTAANETESTAAPQSGGELRYAISRNLTCIDPQVSGDTNATLVARTMVDSLLYLDDEGEFHPWLATEWEASDDFSSYTFTLRDDVIFHDGTPFDAEAVKANFDRIADPATASQKARSQLGPYESSEVVDEYTVTVSFTEPYAVFLEQLASANLGMLSPTAFASGDMCNEPVGSGPFVFSSLDPSVSLVEDRNPDYAWGPAAFEKQDAAYLDRIVFNIVADPTVRAGLVGAGQAEVGDTIVPAQMATLGPDVQVVRIPQPGVPYSLFFNQESAVEPWTDPVAREAFRAAVDVDSIVETLYQGEYPRAWGPLTPVTPGYDSAVEDSWEYDVDEANRLFDELGYTERDGEGFRTRDGERLSIRMPTYGPQPEQRSDVQVFVKDQLAEVGVEIVIDTEQPPEYLEDLQNARYDLADFSSILHSPDVLRLTYHSSNLPSPGTIRTNFSRLVDADVDAALVEAAGMPLGQERDDLYAQLQEDVIGNVWAIPIYVPTRIIAAASEVQDLVPGVEGYPLLYYAHLTGG